MRKETYQKRVLKALGMTDEEIRRLDDHKRELTNVIETGEKNLNIPEIPDEVSEKIATRLFEYHREGHRGKDLIDYHKKLYMEMAGLTEEQADFYVHSFGLCIMEIFLGLENLNYVIDRKKKTKDYTV